MNAGKLFFVVGFVGLIGCGGSSTPAPAGAGPQGQAGAHSLASISASPNPVVLAAGAQQGSTTLAWTTGDTSQGEVWMATSGQPEILFGGLAAHGSGPAPWISKGGTYEFRLYAGKEHATVLASVIVTTTAK